MNLTRFSSHRAEKALATQNDLNIRVAIVLHIDKAYLLHVIALSGFMKVIECLNIIIVMIISTTK